MKWAIKIKDQDVYYAGCRYGGFTVSTREGNPGIYQPMLFNSREEAEREFGSWTKRYDPISVGAAGKWEIVEWI